MACPKSRRLRSSSTPRGSDETRRARRWPRARVLAKKSESAATLARDALYHQPRDRAGGECSSRLSTLDSRLSFLAAQRSRAGEILGEQRDAMSGSFGEAVALSWNGRRDRIVASEAAGCCDDVVFLAIRVKSATIA